MPDAFGREAEVQRYVRRRRPATAIAVLTIPAAVGLVLAGVSGDRVAFPAVVVSQAGGALVRRLLGTEPLEIAIPVAHPRRVMMAVVGATLAVFVAAALATGGSAGRVAWFAVLAVSAGEALTSRLFYEPRPEPEPGAERAFSLAPDEADRLRDESLRGVLPRGF